MKIKIIYIIYAVIAIVLILFFGSFRSAETTEIRVIVMNDPSMRPIATNEDFFWYNKAFHDSVTIKSSGLINFIQKRVTGLKKSTIGGFSVSSSLIIRKDKSSDTLYSDQFFEYWKIQGVYYRDTAGDLNGMLGGFFIE